MWLRITAQSGPKSVKVKTNRTTDSGVLIRPGWSYRGSGCENGRRCSLNSKLKD